MSNLSAQLGRDSGLLLAAALDRDRPRGGELAMSRAIDQFHGDEDRAVGLANLETAATV